ncbi:MAG: hypothetical protein FVQ84_05065 [Planctomycetes bacterium]|nr:hypothetical protein [Planctomycetota bacterium]
MTKQTIRKQIRKLFLFIPVSIALSGMVVLAYQGYFWMKLGHWKSLDSRLVLNKVLPINFLQWLRNPSSWLGLKKIISPFFNFPLALFLLLVGLIAILLLSKIFDLFSKPEKIGVLDSRSWRTG